MTDFVDYVTEQIEMDEEEVKRRHDAEQLFIMEIVKHWIQMRVKDREDFSLRIRAMGCIVESEEFTRAAKLTREILKQGKDVQDKATEAARLITQLSQSDTYEQNKDLSAYKILDEYHDPETYKTESFLNHAYIMERFMKYAREIEERANAGGDFRFAD